MTKVNKITSKLIKQHFYPKSSKKLKNLAEHVIYFRKTFKEANLYLYDNWYLALGYDNKTIPLIENTKL